MVRRVRGGVVVDAARSGVRLISRAYIASNYTVKMTGSVLDRSLAAELVRDLSVAGAATATVLAPCTGEVLHEVPKGTRNDVEDAAAAARVAAIAWQRAGFAHRRRVLLKAHDLLLERREQILDALQSESG